MKPQISIIVPVYNVKAFLSECVESLLAQTYRDFEIILVDDGSTDGSEKLVDDFKRQDDRIHAIHQKNAGLSAARNAGIKKAKGDYLAFVDSDDSVAPTFLEELHNVLQSSHADIAVCGYDSKLPQSTTLSGEDAAVQLLTKQENLDILAWNKLYKKSLFLEYGIFFPEGKIHEDNLTTYKLYAVAQKVVFLPKTLYHYRQRSDSITSKTRQAHHLGMRELAAREAVAYFAGNPRLKSAAEISLLLAKFAWLDNSLTARVSAKHQAETLAWLKAHRNDFQNNPFLTSKLKLYLALSTRLGGVGYQLFRTLRHD